MTLPPRNESPVQPTSSPPHGEPAHRPALTALARLVQAVADLAAVFETTLAEWRQKAQAAKG
jgi:hypothetical protein